MQVSDVSKKAAAKKALEYVSDGMIIGLGIGSTAWWFLELLALRCERENLIIKGIPTSTKTEEHALKLGIELSSLKDEKKLDLVVDGADEFDSKKNLIKGGGGALLQEKIVASVSEKIIIIADETKQVKNLGSFPLPVEIVRFGSEATFQQVKELLASLSYNDAKIFWRMDLDDRFISDERHYILDLHLDYISDSRELHMALLTIPGVVETGLFLNYAEKIIVGHKNGRIQIL